MRIASDHTSPDWADDAWCFAVRVDGVPLADCVWADTELGLAWTRVVVPASDPVPEMPTLAEAFLHHFCYIAHRGVVTLHDLRLGPPPPHPTELP